MQWEVDHSWTLFLDRDGVINERLIDDYVKIIEEFRLLEGVKEAVELARNLFGRIVVVTNQQGIGKGLMTERNLSDIHAYCLKLVGEGQIDQFYFAPNLASENSNMRKPNSGMALQAKQDFPEIDFERAVMIGDSNSDIEFGKRLGMKTVFISDEKIHPTADKTTTSLIAAINWIIS